MEERKEKRKFRLFEGRHKAEESLSDKARFISGRRGEKESCEYSHINNFSPVTTIIKALMTALS